MGNGWAPKVYKPTIDNFRLKALFFGSPGVGKTTLAVSANECEWMSPTLLVNVEGGTLVTIGRDSATWDFANFADLESLFNWLAYSKENTYKTVIIDTLSELQAKNLEAIVGKAIERGNNAKRIDQDDIWQEDYQKSTQYMRRVVRRFRDLPLHVIFTCHDTVMTDGGNVDRVVPALTPKLRASVTGMVDVLGYLYVATVEAEGSGEQKLVRRLLVQPSGKYTAKDRTPGSKLGVFIEDPTMSVIAEKIRSI